MGHGDPAMLAAPARTRTHAAVAFESADPDSGDVETDHEDAGDAWHPDDSPVSCLVLDIYGRVIGTVWTVMRFDTAVEVTTSELRVELMYPAVADGDRALGEFVALATGGGHGDRTGDYGGGCGGDHAAAEGR
jgi:hypothetical protein